MTSRDFCYWLQGLFELAEPTNLTVKQVDLIKRHLVLVFKHEIDPSFGDEKMQEILNEIHSPKKNLPLPGHGDGSGGSIRC